MSLPRAATASASQSPPGAAPPSVPESPTPLLAPLPPSRLSTRQGTGHLLLAQPRPLLSFEDLGPQGAWGPISTHLSNYTLWERQEYGLGSRPQFTLNTFSFFSFIYWSSLRCVLKTSTVAFKKTVKSLCSTLRIKSSFSTLK